MKFLYNNKILKAIESMVVDPKLESLPLNIAVAYWGKNSIKETGFKLRQKKSQQNVKVICDLRSGACNPAPIKELQELGCNVRTLENMHAKVWQCGDQAIIGSSNASANGLGFDDGDLMKGNREAAIHISNVGVAETIDSWFDNLWNKSGPINAELLQRAKLAFNKRKKSREHSLGFKKVTLLDHLERTKERKKWENVHILVWEDDEQATPEKTEKRMQEYAKSDKAQELYLDKEWQDDRNRDFWRLSDLGWKFTRGNIYIEFVYSHGRRGLRYEGIKKIVSNDNAHEKIEDQYVVLCYRENDCQGHLVTRREQQELMRMIKHYKKNNGERWVEKMDAAGNLLDMNLREFVNDKAFDDKVFRAQ